MKRFLSAVFTTLSRIFKSDQTKKALEQVLTVVPVALPYVYFFAKIIAGVTPPTIDDWALQELNANFPRLFDGSITDVEELKRYCARAAAALVKAKFPAITTNMANIAVEIAVLKQKEDEKPA